MDIEAGFPMPGVPPTPQAGDGRAISLALGSPAELKDGFPQDAERISQVLYEDGTVAFSVDAAEDSGYLMYAKGFGSARLARDGRQALIAPVDEPAWIWQRCLTGQLLPLAALVQGLEVFHACVLGLDGRAIAVVAHSGVGKTTTALRLALLGLDFMSDDVLVVEPNGSGVRAHPAVGLANVRPGSGDLLLELERAGLAEPIGSNEQETRIAVRRADEPLPLGALFVLRRHTRDTELRVERPDPVDPRMLLASTFNFSVRTPERLARQLDVCARLDSSAAVYLVDSGSDVPSADVAEAILQHAKESIAR